MQNLRQNLFANKTPLLIIFLVIATVILVALAMAPNRPSLPTPNLGAQKEIIADSSLSLSELYQIDEDEEASEAAVVSYQSDVQIMTGKNKVTGVQLEIKYDPALITTVDVLPGDFFQNPTELLKKIDTEEGIISYALGTENKGLSGKGVVATITFVPRTGVRGETAFEFLSKTTVVAENADQTVLKEMSGLEFSLGSSTPTSSSAQPASL
ncbi:MAG: hypothetical protein A2186_02670 [Candidatus Levybacteria bacterium RIFOXYA1_FULL_41_10]|nr:MAG: hypothetical protein UT87_C0007G0068 [Candidatus Levybacteria bacterium GW2011_GWC1_40_19]KKR72199.1 MAG: hypothetical protein UU15_C0033G0008 [Candidatus Levybacteria bacterium GW2011_GWC2_40_7]KKR94607.1 MAG: hypothetical protein UU45_C0008G0007 [Candidatus Levybacteria bacterium GW2011_GWA2_41_15]KKS00908.1 MAG: hypothetical protein UU52_C0023G0003 [Candidatus Levybacteria bacterium GW2011_GWB1_41_21]OGH27021.1 MAG: hypothetical protein A3D82_02900 [Candidatus Levybacteria bacterium 